MGRSSTALALLAALAGAASAEALYLSVIPTEVPAGVSVEPSLPLRIALHVPDPRGYASLLGLPAEAVRGDRVETLLRGPLSLPTGDPAALLGSTFLVDHAEPAVMALRTELVARHGAAPSLDELVVFVSRAIEHKDLGRGWDVASRVATTRAGDCTEHAVLLAALARSVGRPARVVIGAAVVAHEGRVATLGHAWAELHDGERWHVADAALADGVKPLAYLPFGVLDDEGPGHMLAVATFGATTWVRRVDLLGNE